MSIMTGFLDTKHFLNRELDNAREFRVIYNIALW